VWKLELPQISDEDGTKIHTNYHMHLKHMNFLLRVYRHYSLDCYRLNQNFVIDALYNYLETLETNI